MKFIPKMLLGMGLMALPALCGPISLNQWYVFGWNGSAPTDALGLGTSSGYTGSLGTQIAGLSCTGASPCSDVSQPWTFTGSGSITVQDLYFSGDRFSVFDNLTLIGTTSNPVNDGSYCGAAGNDPLGCSSDVKFSKGTFSFVGSGAHSITIRIIQESGSFTSGQAVFLVTGSGGGGGGVPEPTTLSMMGLGLGALIFGWRARSKA